MPSTFLTADTMFPWPQKGQRTDEQVGRLTNYVFSLQQDLRYILYNLGVENINSAELDSLAKIITAPVYAQLQDTDGNLATLQITAAGLASRVSDAEGNISAFSQTATSLAAQLSNLNGDMAALQLTASGLTGRINDMEGNVASLTLTASRLTSRISDAEGNISTATQTANKIDWLIASGTSASNFTMTDRAVKLMANTIDLTGYVTISALGTSGKTIINADNITTGTISADRIDVTSLKVRTIYATDGKVAIKSIGNTTLYLGGDSTWNFDHTFIYGESSVRFGRFGAWTSHHLVIDTENYVVHPSTSVDWDLGTITYPFGDVWCENIQLRSGSSTVARFGFNSGVFECTFLGSAVTRLGASTCYWDTGYITKLYLSSGVYLSASGSALCVNGTAVDSSISKLTNDSYTVSLNASAALVPGSSGYALGSSSYYWATAYITKLYLSASCYITAGSSSTIKVGTTTIGGSASVSQLVSGSYTVSLSNYALTPKSAGTYDLGSSSYYWDYLYVKTIRLYYSSYYYIDLTCNSNKKLCVGGTAIH